MPGIVAEYVCREKAEEREFWRRLREMKAQLFLLSAIRREMYKELGEDATYDHCQTKALKYVEEMRKQNPGSCYQALLAQYKSEKWGRV
jgi:hypothetical protein